MPRKNDGSSKKKADNAKVETRDASRPERKKKLISGEPSNRIDGRIRKLLLEYQEAEDVVNTLVSIKAGQSYDDHVPELTSVVVKGQILRISSGYLIALKDAGVVQVADAGTGLNRQVTVNEAQAKSLLSAFGEDSTSTRSRAFGNIASCLCKLGDAKIWLEKLWRLDVPIALRLPERYWGYDEVKHGETASEPWIARILQVLASTGYAEDREMLFKILNEMTDPVWYGGDEDEAAKCRATICNNLRLAGIDSTKHEFKCNTIDNGVVVPVSAAKAKLHKILPDRIWDIALLENKRMLVINEDESFCAKFNKSQINDQPSKIFLALKELWDNRQVVLGKKPPELGEHVQSDRLKSLIGDAADQVVRELRAKMKKEGLPIEIDTAKQSYMLTVTLKTKRGAR